MYKGYCVVLSENNKIRIDDKTCPLKKEIVTATTAAIIHSSKTNDLPRYSQPKGKLLKRYCLISEMFELLVEDDLNYLNLSSFKAIESCLNQLPAISSEIYKNIFCGFIGSF